MEWFWTVLVGVIVVCVVVAVCGNILGRRNARQHSVVCSTYRPCPECRPKHTEPPSNFDRWDGVK